MHTLFGFSCDIDLFIVGLINPLCFLFVWTVWMLSCLLVCSGGVFNMLFPHFLCSVVRCQSCPCFWSLFTVVCLWFWFWQGIIPYSAVHSVRELFIPKDDLEAALKEAQSFPSLRINEVRLTHSFCPSFFCCVLSLFHSLLKEFTAGNRGMLRGTCALSFSLSNSFLFLCFFPQKFWKPV